MIINSIIIFQAILMLLVCLVQFGLQKRINRLESIVEESEGEGHE